MKILRTIEKGSDVNLATALLLDGFKGEYEIAAVITSDADLKAPIKAVVTELKKKVGIINPSKYPSKDLNDISTFIKTIRPYHLERAQFPIELEDTKGKFGKPRDWKNKE